MATAGAEALCMDLQANASGLLYRAGASLPPLDSSASRRRRATMPRGLQPPEGNPTSFRRNSTSPDDERELRSPFDASAHLRESSTTLLRNAPRPAPLRIGTPNVASKQMARSALKPGTPAPSNQRRKTSRAESTSAVEASRPATSPTSVSRSMRSAASLVPTTTPILNPSTLSVLCRVAAVQSDARVAKQQPQLRHKLDLSGIDVRWVYEPERRPSCGWWCDIAQFVKDAGERSMASLHSLTRSAPSESPAKESDLNSPRSVLALLRRGICTKDLRPVDGEAVRRQLRISGLSDAIIDERVEYLHNQRSAAIEEAEAERARLCTVVSIDTVLRFVDLFITEGCNYASVPDVALIAHPHEPSPHATCSGGSDTECGPDSEENQMKSDEDVDVSYGVGISGSDLATDAIAQLRLQTKHEHAVMQRRVALEIDTRSRATAIHAARARRLMEKALDREAAGVEREANKSLEATLRKLIAEDKAKVREEQRRRREASLEREHDAQAARLAEQEKLKAAGHQLRRDQRYKRVAARGRARSARLADAARAARVLEERRLERIAESDTRRTIVAEQRVEKLEARRAESILKAQRQHERHVAIQEFGEKLEAQRRQQFDEKATSVAKTLAAHETQKAEARELRELRGLQKELWLDDRRKAAAEEGERRLQEKQDLAEQQLTRFRSDRKAWADQRDRTAEAIRERELQRKASVEKNERKAMFERYAVEGAMLAKVETTVQASQLRSTLALEARANRIRVGVQRHDQLEEAHSAAIVAERNSYFDLQAQEQARRQTVLSSASTRKGSSRPPTTVGGRRRAQTPGTRPPLAPEVLKHTAASPNPAVPCATDVGL